MDTTPSVPETGTRVGFWTQVTGGSKKLGRHGSRLREVGVSNLCHMFPISHLSDITHAQTSPTHLS